MTKKKVTIERTLRAPLADVWALWTTREGIESWWGPEGFRVTVRHLDLRPGGELLYVMEAVGPDQIAFMKRAGMPTAHDARIVYREGLDWVSPLPDAALGRLAFRYLRGEREANALAKALRAGESFDRDRAAMLVERSGARIAAES